MLRRSAKRATFHRQNIGQKPILLSLTGLCAPMLLRMEETARRIRSRRAPAAVRCMACDAWCVRPLLCCSKHTTCYMHMFMHMDMDMYMCMC